MSAALAEPEVIEEVKPSFGLQLATKVTHGYMHLIERTWGEFGSRGRAVHFEPCGLARVASILGWIEAMSQVGVENVEAVAEDFVSNMDYLANYGGTEERESSGRKHQFPRFRVCMGDDGMTHSFSLAWYKLLEPEEMPEQFLQRTGRQARIFGTLWTDLHYGYWGNGGLIYHGSGRAGDTFAVNLTSHKNQFWSVHT